MNRRALDELKQQIPLLDYLQAHDWRPARRIRDERQMGLCPLHTDHKPSFLVDPHKNLFYCYGCGRGGDVIRFAELYHQVKFSEAVALLREWCGLAPLLDQVIDFYRIQLFRHHDAVSYLYDRGLRGAEVIEHMRIGYAPGRCLRARLTDLGYPAAVLRQAGLVNAAGNDAFVQRVIFPLEGNLYGRSIRGSAPHLFLPGSKGGLYAWERVRRCPEVILVEGLFDYAVLWQAGFHHVTCSMGSHLNARQFQQLCDGTRTVYLAFDSDQNQSGQLAAQWMSRRLWAQGVTARRVQLPDGQDPNSFFVEGGDAPSVPASVGGRSSMTFQVVHQPHPKPAQSPYRIVQHETEREAVWVNRFLDRECIRCLAETTLRSYALDLLHFLRWWFSVHQTDTVTEQALTESTLLEYVRFQAGQSPRPAAATINRRVVVADRALKSEFPNAPGQFAPGFHQLYWKRSPMSVARPRQALSRLRVKAPKRVILPLSVDEVARFWSSFRTSRDLAIVGLMLLQGLRSKEVLSLNQDDLLLAESQIRVRGKGSKIRFLPLGPETVELLDHYLRLERPTINDTAVFVSLKGRARGTRMTPAGLRSLFRHHRITTGVVHANPHRFRHTFASDMIRAGVSLPALMQLMGHSQIQTTLVYVQLTPLDVYQQYARAVKQHVRPTLPPEP